MIEEPEPTQDHPDDPPPFLGTWNRVYALVLVYLVVLIGVFYLFGAAYTP